MGSEYRGVARACCGECPAHQECPDAAQAFQAVGSRGSRPTPGARRLAPLDGSAGRAYARAGMSPGSGPRGSGQPSAGPFPKQVPATFPAGSLSAALSCSPSPSLRRPLRAARRWAGRCHAGGVTGAPPMPHLLMAFAVAGSLSLIAGPRVAAGQAPAQDAAGGRVCGFLHARVPYSTAGGGPAWRVYVRGGASCGAAAGPLNAVLHLQGVNHDNGSESNSYFTYGDWTCPYGQMGSQVCFLGSPSHPRARALALRCSEVRCPTGRAPDF